MRWGKICVIVNLITVVASLSGLSILYWLMTNEFQELPEKNIWTKADCQVIKNYQNGYYEVIILNNHTVAPRVNLTDGLCGWDTGTLVLNHQNPITNFSDIFNNSVVKCSIPPLPIIMAECTYQTPINNLILLDDQAEKIQELLERHLEYYWSALACAVVAMLCCFWCCYSYWFNWCGCQDQSYWYCGRSNYLHFFNASNGDIEEDFRINFN